MLGDRYDYDGIPLLKLSQVQEKNKKSYRRKNIKMRIPI